jgi:xylitol oxidase
MRPIPFMNKRTFLKLCSAALTGPVLSPLFAWAQGDKLKNWAGNLEYGTERLSTADSLEHVQAFVKKENRLKVLGTRHCFNDIANSSDQFLSVKTMDKVVALDPDARTVTVEAGMTYGQLCPYLDSKGWALHNLASLPHISVAGACSTATHGSGDKNGNLATAVSALEMVDAAGNVVRLTREKDGETFRGAVVGLGALGVITKVTLDIQPRFMMQQHVYQNLPLRGLKDHFDAIETSAYSVSLFTDWRNEFLNEVWLKNRIEPGRKSDAPPDFFGAKPATRNLHPIAELSAENCTEQMGVPGPWYERLPHFRMGFTPSAGKELQSEYFVPRPHAVEAILAVQRLHDQISPHLLISEIRTIAADDLWMSPCYRQPSVTIHFTWKQDWPAVQKLLPLIENELAPFHPRPHWGKLFTIPSEQLHSSYEKLPEFVELSRKYDPQGKFQNEFLRSHVFGPIS